MVISDTFTSHDRSRRYLLQLDDGQLIESVLIPREGRVTFCVSSQIGCSLGCTFCLTGQLGLARDLSADEIISQVVLLRSELRPDESQRFSVVFMGMGEPLQNYDNVLRAIRTLHEDRELQLPMGRITISTAGLIPAMERLAHEPLFPNLSISLTGATTETRDALMPINRKYPIEAVVEIIRRLPQSRQKRVMIECVMIKGLTDLPAEAERLSELLRGTCAKVNLIPLNAADEIPYERSDAAAILEFQQTLIRTGIATFIRKNRGNDVSGACGQLKKKIMVGDRI